jgi:hypothetical protein
MITPVLCLLLALWQDPPLPTEITLDKDEQILKKYGVYNPPIPFPSSMTPENVTGFYDYPNRHRSGIVISIGNLLLVLPELIFDEVVLGLHTLASDSDDTLTSKVLSVDVSGSSGHLFPEFLTFFSERESRFFAGFGDSYLATPDVERGVADVDMAALIVEQRKVMWDVLKKTYFSKYKFRAEERIHEDAFYVNKWRGVDFVTLPPFIAAYLYYRGLDKSFTVYGTQVHILVEPGMRFFAKSDIIGAFIIDWRPTKDFPIGIIASTGMYNGKPEFEFIGIGTSIGEAKKAIALAQPVR